MEDLLCRGAPAGAPVASGTSNASKVSMRASMITMLTVEQDGTVVAFPL
ncbi:hypothetical protein [Isoptericola halotolerans]|uniref:Uncharacterized protein n=1 Tax=Isoptericola halotolerans TaxID=300560 RepID=A0ABX1ZYG6_9MICO|nr:hypothetical protein [Isoptericola halotolerans]NOV95654.1 hypothetical protein [Isoptericola halotolerans]